MDLRNKLPQVLLYFFVGGVAALTDLMIFFVMTELMGFNYILVSLLGFLIATLVNYKLSILVVFESEVRFKRSIEILFVYTVSSVGLAVHIITLYIFIDLLTIDKMISKVSAIFVAFIFNYLLRKHYVFRRSIT